MTERARERLAQVLEERGKQKDCPGDRNPYTDRDGCFREGVIFTQHGRTIRNSGALAPGVMADKSRTDDLFQLDKEKLRPP